MRRWGLFLAVVLAASGCTWAQRVDVEQDRTTPATAADHARAVAVDFEGDSYMFITPVGLAPDDADGTDDVYWSPADGVVGAQLVPTAPDIASYSFKGTEYGNEVLFTTGVALNAGDTNTHPDVYAKGVFGGAPERISVGTSGEIPGSLGAVLDDVSRDGHFVVFTVTKADGPHLYYRNRTTGTTTEIPLAIGQHFAGISSSGAVVLSLIDGSGGKTIKVTTTFTTSVDTPRCKVTDAVLAPGGGWVFGAFVGGTGCPTGFARYQWGSSPANYESIPVPAGAAPVPVGADDAGNFVLWRDGASKQYFVTSIRTGRTQRVSEGGFPPQPVAVDEAAMSDDGSSVALIAATPFPGAGPANGANGVFEHSTMEPVVDPPSPTSLARGSDTFGVRLHLHDSFEMQRYAVSFGEGVHVQLTSAGNLDGITDLLLHVTVDADAPRGLRNVTVIELHRWGYTVGTCIGCFGVT
jgi:hypothetical protein